MKETAPSRQGIPGPHVSTAPQADENCVDVESICYADECEVAGMADFMAINCAKTCGKCQSSRALIPCYSTKSMVLFRNCEIFLTN